MSDVDLAATGKDTKIVITVDGALKEVVDQVTNFTCKVSYDEVTTKPLGRSGSLIDNEFVGWEGDLELTMNTAEVDEMMDLVNAALIARIPLLINITDTTHYRDGTSKTYTYPDCKLQFDAKKKRGEANSMTLRWKTGSNRIAS